MDNSDRDWRKQLAASRARFANEGETYELGLHLGDLRAGCANAIRLIEQIAAFEDNADPALIRKTFASLNGELVDHMMPHIQQVKRPLKTLSLRLYREADARGDYMGPYGWPEHRPASDSKEP